LLHQRVLPGFNFRGFFVGGVEGKSRQAEEKWSSLLPAHRKIREILNRGELSTGSNKSAVHNAITGQ